MKKEKIKIDITLSKETQIFNQYSKEQLSDELSNYIYNQCKGNSSKKNIKINIYPERKIDEEEQKQIIDAIRSNYGIDIKENMLRLKYDILFEIILIVFGSILLILSNILSKLNTIVLGELISIFGCVMIWEAAYNFIFQDVKTALENRRLKKLTEAKIYFKEKD